MNHRVCGCPKSVYKPTWRKGNPPVPTLEKVGEIFWDFVANQALESLKKQLSQAPIQAAPKPKEPMLLYISSNNRAVSVVVVVEQMDADKEHQSIMLVRS